MRASSQAIRRAVPLLGCLALLAAAAPGPGAGQLISLRTVPIPTGEQYVLLPSRALGMGGVGIALEDPLLDPFANPAKGGRLRGARIFGAPTFYSVSDDRGAGRTLTTGLLGRTGDLFGGLSFALQEIQDQNPGFGLLPPGTPDPESFLGGDPSNTYVQALIGTRVGRRTSVGVSVSHASLEGVDGINLLYANSFHVGQEGGITGLRAGLVHELEDGGWIEAVVTHDRVDVTHEVTYVQWWRVPSGPFCACPPEPRTWTETNQDRTRTTGIHIGGVRALDDAPGWSLGALLTANRKSHPKIPNYDVASIPRDPGNSTAFDVGIGLSQRRDGRLFAVDFVYEPAWSHTWAYAGDTAVVTPSGRVIETGEKTVDNRFRFGNLLLAAGFATEKESWGWQVGLGLRAFRYRLRQHDLARERFVKTREDWTEWTPTWGLHKRFDDLEVRWSGRLTLKGFPDLWVAVEDRVVAPQPGAGQDFLVPVTGPVNLPDYSIFTNQFSVSLPIGGGGR